MPLFEVFIPTTDPDGFNITARIRADSWTQALRNGLTKLGDAADARNLLCDITETSIDVTEPTTGRVFRIRELEEAQGPASPGAALAASVSAPPLVQQAPPQAERAPPPHVAAPVLAAPPPAAVSQAKPITASAPPPAAPAVPAAALQKVPAAGAEADAEELIVREKASDAAPFQAIGRGKQVEEPIEDIISDLLLETQGLYDQPNVQAAASYILALAERTIPADAGAVFIADINRQDLFFAAASGPKADAAMAFRVPMGQGLVGFSAQEGVAVAISDAHRDPRFYAAVSEKIGYETKSILCSPAQKEGRVFGALELINKVNGTSFTGREMSLLNFLAHEFADYLINTGQTGQ